MRTRMSSSSCARVFRGGGIGTLTAWHKAGVLGQVCRRNGQEALGSSFPLGNWPRGAQGDSHFSTGEGGALRGHTHPVGWMFTRLSLGM
jgi:hypothetical protein